MKSERISNASRTHLCSEDVNVAVTSPRRIAYLERTVLAGT